VTELPAITVIIPTLDRVQLLEQTLKLLNENLVYPGRINYLVGDDGAGGEVEELAKWLAFGDNIRVIGDGTRHGLGGNVNRLLRACETDIVLQTQDDFHLVRRLELAEHVLKLLEDETAGWIRLRLIQGQHFTATVSGERYWRLSWFSEGQYIASDQPHLKHWRRWHEHYGFYPEGVTIAETENGWCSKTKEIGQQSGRKLDVLVPTNWEPDSSWPHLGDEISWNLRGY
jgi:glycosyltransferase involved in cell wall biosynthesis